MPFRNTGEQEAEQYDTNPKSATFGQKRWISIGTNTTACPLPVATQGEFKSVAITEIVFRNDCKDQQTPNGVNYTLAAGFYASLKSQLDADNEARKYFDAKKQEYANANDTCSTVGGSVINNCVMDTNGCWTGLIIHEGEVAGTFYTTQEEYNACFSPHGNRGAGFTCGPV